MVLNSYFKYFCKLCHVFVKLNKIVIITIIIKDKIISARNNAHEKEAGESLLVEILIVFSQSVHSNFRTLWLALYNDYAPQGRCIALGIYLLLGIYPLLFISTTWDSC